MKLSADALLFDNDGTLVSSMTSVFRCWTRWAQEYGVAAEDFARVGLHGRTAAGIIGDLLPAARVPEALARIDELEIEDVAGGITALPGTLQLLGTLPPDRWAVVTSANRRLAEARLGEVGIRPNLLVTADDTERGKPDPQPFLLAAEKLGFAPARCVVFEDAPAGLAAARAAGMQAVALTTTVDRSELAAADVVVQDLSSVSVRAVGAELEVTAVPAAY
jgi:mannitol-1-/sugar-/sorbitol-6-phosphatase